MPILGISFGILKTIVADKIVYSFLCHDSTSANFMQGLGWYVAKQTVDEHGDHADGFFEEHAGELKPTNVGENGWHTPSAVSHVFPCGRLKEHACMSSIPNKHGNQQASGKPA